MKPPSLFLTALAPILLSGSALAETRVFTDDQGRTVKATLAGIRGDNVVLSHNGRSAQWPIAKLSKSDRAYVAQWKKNPPETPRIVVNLWERDGVGPKGKYEQKKGLELPKNIPGVLETNQTAKYKHYEVDMTNNAAIDASHLTVAYVMYVIGGQGGTVQELPASIAVETVPTRERVTATTMGATYVRTKTKLTTFSLNRGTLTTGKDRNVSKERFGGIWVRIYSQDGQVVGEAQKLHPEIARLKPTWNGPKEDEHIESPELFDMLAEFLDKLPKPPGAPDLPPKPELPEKPSKPKAPTPPSAPKLPFPPKR